MARDTIMAVILFFGFTLAGVEGIGVCYGGLGDNLPSSSDVIGLYKEHHIGAIRFYAPNKEAFQGLRGSNIEVIVDVELNLEAVANDVNVAHGWVDGNIKPFAQDVNFRYIAVGNEFIPGSAARFILGAMTNIQTAVEAAGLKDKIKVSTAVSSGVIASNYPPSAGTFTPEAITSLQGIGNFLNAQGSPLLINIYPYFTYLNNIATMDFDYAVLNSNVPKVIDGVFQYKNVLEAMIDTFYAALEKIGVGGVRLVVSETGWPSGEGPAATFQNAQTYLTNLIGLAGKGTPRRSTTPTEIYIFAMFDEDEKEPHGTENDYGIFHPNKQPKYSLQF